MRRCRRSRGIGPATWRKRGKELASHRRKLWHSEALEPRNLLTASLSLGTPPLDAPAIPADQLWQAVESISAPSPQAQSYLQPTQFASFMLDEALLSAAVSQAPLEFTDAAEASPLVIALPHPAGGFARFEIVVSPIMAPELAANYPQIATFSGQGIDDPAASLRMDITPLGFHAQVLSPSGRWYIDPYWHLHDDAYISYFGRDLTRLPGRDFFEGEIERPGEKAKHAAAESEEEHEWRAAARDDAAGTASDGQGKGDAPPLLGRSGGQLRTYQLAVAATGEYTTFFGGTKTAGQSAIVTAVNRVTGIYETELAVRLELIPNNDLLVYTDAFSDPYSNNNASALLSENQSNIDAVIGDANYDIGHVFSTGGGGLAALGVVGVSGQKALGETGLSSPVGDVFYVDYVAHEIGHQFGGNHTFNGVNGAASGNRNAATAYEPGSGSTIMAYAGITGADDLQNNSDPYFHSISFDEIVALTRSGAANSAAAITNTGNSAPRVNAGGDFTIPARTPFVLSAAGADSDSGDVLTYHFEQRDLGPAQALSASDNGASPLFRSFTPTQNPNRVLPRLTDLLANTTAPGERLPTTNRTLNFRAVVRDNRSGGGGVNTDDMQVQVVDTGAAFAVTAPNTAVTWSGGASQTVTWDVAGTTSAPINAANVNILLSTDGGATFGILLAANTPNDGSQSVTIPDLSTTQARIKVEAADNIFFDVSNANFTISGGANTPPTISDIFNRLVQMNGATGAIPFTIGDGQTAVGSLTVAASSSNPTLIPSGGLVLGGSGASRTISVTPAAGQYGQATVSVTVTDGGGLTVQDTFLVIVEPVYSYFLYENFDGVSAPNLPAGWVSSASGAAAVQWTTSTTGSDSGANNAFVPNPGQVSDDRLTSPTIAVTQSNFRIQFRNRYDLEATYDGGVLEVSIDGGAFTDILAAGGSFLSGGYNGVLDTGYQNPLAGRQAWTGDSGGYIDTLAELPASAIGKNVQWRWRLGTDNVISDTGWRIDTVSLGGIASSAGLTVTQSGGSTQVAESGTTDTFTVALASQPASNVVITVTSGDTGEATVDKASLTFTPSDWSTAQTVTVTGVDDALDDGDQTTQITLHVDDANSDDAYDGVADSTVSVVTADDDISTDIVLQSVKATGSTTLQVQYEVLGAAVGAFAIDFYRSANGTFESGADLLLDSVSVSAAAELAVGVHTLSLPIGGGAGQVALPGAGATETTFDYQVLAVVDPTDGIEEADADPVAEDNIGSLTGAYASGSNVLVHGGAGDDTITITGTLTLSINGVTQNYSATTVKEFHIRSHGGADVVSGANINEIMKFWGGDGNDTLTGGKLADRLEGGAGDDDLFGGASDDVYVFDADGSLGADDLTDSAGLDTLDFSESASGVSVNLDLTGTQTVNGNLSITLALTSSKRAFEHLIGGAGNDTLLGNSLANTLTGGAGSDTLGGAGGNDSYVFAAASASETDTVVEASGGGVDTLNFAALVSGNGVTVNLSPADTTIASHTNRTVVVGAVADAAFFENITGGGGGDTLIGNASANKLLGNGGADTLEGRAGADTLTGGGGNDTLKGGGGDDLYTFASASSTETDTVLELSGEGVDKLDFSTLSSSIPVSADLASSSTTIASHTRRTVVAPAVADKAFLENITGGAGADTLIGNASANVLVGGSGADTLEGLGGADTLEGGAGGDTLKGGGDDDSYIFKAASGSEVDTVFELLGEGVDTLDFSALSSSVPVTINLKNDSSTATHTGRTLKTGAAGQAAYLERAFGGAGADNITGNAADNLLKGNNGADTLDGDAGTDTLDGGAGTDTGVNGEILISIP